MSMIDEILEYGLEHLPGCELGMPIWPVGSGGVVVRAKCSCGADKRRKYLERLKEPTPEMLRAGWSIADNPAIRRYNDVLAKAEEDL